MSPKPTKATLVQKDLITETSQQSLTEYHTEDLYELLRDSPDNYFIKQQTHPEIDSKPDIHHNSPVKNHVTINTSCDDKKQPLLSEDLTEHIQFDKERNVISPKLNFFDIEAKTTYVLHTDGLRKTDT